MTALAVTLDALQIQAVDVKSLHVETAAVPTLLAVVKSPLVAADVQMHVALTQHADAKSQHAVLTPAADAKCLHAVADVLTHVALTQHADAKSQHVALILAADAKCHLAVADVQTLVLLLLAVAKSLHVTHAVDATLVAASLAVVLFLSF